MTIPSKLYAFFLLPLRLAVHFSFVKNQYETAQEIRMDASVLDGPKPVRILRRLLTLANLKDDSIVLDFFPGLVS